MYKQYIKQALALLRQDKLYSSVYIVGTGLAICTVMVLAMVFYIKVAPVYPEVNRDRTVIAPRTILRVPFTDEKGEQHFSSSAGAFDPDFVNKYLSNLPSVEIVGLSSVAGRRAKEHPIMRLTDGNYWHVFRHRFIFGAPYTNDDFTPEGRKAVMSESTAQRLYGKKDAVGETFAFEGMNFTVCGVVRDVSYATPESFAQVWLSMRVGDIGKSRYPVNQGEYRLYMLARSGVAMSKVVAEVNDVMRRLNESEEMKTERGRCEFDLGGGPLPYWKYELQRSLVSESNQLWDGKRFDWGELMKLLIPILLALLLIPAVNLMGMVSSRMDERLPEFGIRKAFGASTGSLMRMILTENLVLTLCGGLAGLILSYALMYTGSNWVLTLFNTTGNVVPSGAVTFYTVDMLFNPTIFAATLMVCFVLNYLSASIPARMAMKKSIVYNLSQK